MSLIMIIIIQGNTPFIEKSDNTMETINELIILMTLYHMILISDFVPNDCNDLREAVGMSLIGFLTVTIFLFLLKIIINLFEKPIKMLRRMWIRRNMKKR